MATIGHVFARPGAPALRPGQALALRACALAPPPRGVAASLPVGEGKTLVAMLAAEAFALGPGGRPARPLVLVPAPLVRQWGTMVAEARGWFNFTPPTAMSYGKLSTPKGEAAFRDLAPDLVIFDEAHVLANLTSARTRRVLRWFVERPTTRALVLSGTLGARSIRQFAHLLELALREGAPIPLDSRTLDQWAACLDPKGEPAAEDWRALWPVVRAFAAKDPGPLYLDYRREPFEARRARARRAFARRLASAPGYVTVRGSGVGASLRMATMRPEVPAAVEEALRTLADDWALPDGTELVDALEFDRHAGSLSVGFYRRQTWPKCGECGGGGRLPDPRDRGGFQAITYQGHDCPKCDGLGHVVDTEWIEARRAWFAAVRNALEWQAGPGFDSPALVEAAAAEGRVSDRLLRLYGRWLAAKDRPGPGSAVEWLPGAREWLQGIAATWCAARPAGAGGILWWSSPAVGEALAEVGGIGGPFGAGSTQPTKGPGAHGGPGSTFPAVSRRVHGTGWNAQEWHENLIVEVPSDATAFEQLLGRTHRPGQLAGVVRADVLVPTWRARRALETALARAAYVAESRGETQKLTIAQWE